MLYFLSILSLFSVASALGIPGERIVNGKSIEIQETPWQVALLQNSKLICGGSIVSNRIIITAAHCLVNALPENLSIVAGSKYWNKGGQRIKVKDFKVHEGYIIGNVGLNDVGVLLLSHTVEYNSEVKPIDIARKSPEVGDFASVSGWGSLTFFPDTFFPEDLHGLDIQIINVSNDEITTSPGLKNVYHGDSGGPLVVNNELVGAVSGCKSPNFSTTYPNLAQHYHWIQNAVANMVHA